MGTQPLLVLLLLAAGFARVAATVGDDETAKVLAQDDECGEETSNACSLAALQVRGAKIEPDIETVSTEPATIPEENGTLHAESASCRTYGCGGYNPAHSCQCNSECHRHGNCCRDIQSVCSHSSHSSSGQSHSYRHGMIKTLYHQTSTSIGPRILSGGFRSGHIGYCGGGIYFADSPWSTFTKAVGTESHMGFMIEAQVDLGKSVHISKPSCFSPEIGVAKLIHEPASHYLHKYDADSFTFNPGDGMEYVIVDPRRVVSMRRYW